MITASPRLDHAVQRLSRCDLDDGPRLCLFEVTAACDLACLYCRACAQAVAADRELTTREACSLIDQLTEFDEPPQLVLTGGDPFKRGDLFELIEHAVSRRLDVSITASSSPLCTDAAIRRLQASGVQRMAVSIDGANAVTHDNFRGAPGSFDRSLRMLGSAASWGLPTQVNTTATPHILEQIDEVAELLAGLSIEMWSVFFLVPTGSAGDLARLTAAQCEAVFARLWLQAQQQPYAIRAAEAPHFRRYVMQRRRRRTCATCHCASRSAFASEGINDGKGVMFVSSTGVIQPSGFLPIECGRFPRDHVADIYRYSPVFRALRDVRRLEGKCGVCEYRRVCGGSRARAYAVTGNMLAQEPDCNYVPDAWS